MEPADKDKKPTTSDQSETKEDTTTVDPEFSEKIARKLLGDGEFDAEQLQKLSKDIASGKVSRELVEYEKQYKELTKPHAFWDTQPVPKIIDKTADTDGPLEKDNDLAAVQKDPYPLLDQFEWAQIDMHNKQHVEELYTFLKENYVEDDDGLFRFDYSKEFLVWALTPPGYYPDWLIGVRVKKNQKLVGFISGIPVHLQVNKHLVKQTEINFLCVHKKLRANRLSPVLIKEVTRRVHLRNMWQAIYTSGTLLPTPVVAAKYYHRSLNPKKLIEIKFSSLGRNSTMSRTIKLYKLPEEPTTPGLRLMKKKDAPAVHKLLNEYLSKFSLYLKFSEDDIRHWFLPRENVITTYVVENEKKITDLISYYSLPSSVLQNPKYDRLNAAYSFYNVATSVPYKQLMHDALILACKDGYDVFNALNILDNAEVFSDLNFSQGDGKLHYYLYNWQLAKELKNTEVGIVLL